MGLQLAVETSLCLFMLHHWKILQTLVSVSKYVDHMQNGQTFRLKFPVIIFLHDKLVIRLPLEGTSHTRGRESQTPLFDTGI